MSDDLDQILDLIKNIHLFFGLEQSQLIQVARSFQVEHFRPGKTVVLQGQPGDCFYIIMSGKVKVTLRKGKQKRDLATLVRGDYFGGEALLYGRRRSASVITVDDSVLLSMDREAFRKIKRNIKRFAPNLELSAESHQLSRRMTFDWLAPDEVIYLISRKHKTILLSHLVGPAIFAGLSLVMIWLSSIIQISLPIYIGAGMMLVAIGYGIWEWIDWGNDYYILTNHRVIWLEKVVGLYDSRQEAPLRTILSVSQNTSPTGRVMGSGDVVVRTFTGKIVMRDVGRHEEMAALIEEHWRRTKVLLQKDKENVIEQAIRQRLNLPAKELNYKEPEVVEEVPEQREPGIFELIFANLFKVRYENEGVITFRKHMFILLRDTWKPTLGLISSILLPIIWLVFKITLPSWRSMTMFGVVGFIVSALFWLYQYEDWRNDIYQVTPDHIVDVEKKPFGSEEKKSAPLENILSLDYEREGIIGHLLNFGSVKARVGGSTFSFNDVYDPAGVQRDIFQRMDARMQKKREAEAARERQRMADWVAVYHNNKEEYDRLEQERRLIEEENNEVQ